MRKNYNFTLKNPVKSDILLLDENYSDLKFRNLKSFIYDYKKIYLKIFIRSIFVYFLKIKAKIILKKFI